MTDFFSLVEETNLCPTGSVVGVATVIANEPELHVFTKTVPVFNLTPSQGEPARLGFEVAGKVPIVIDTSVRSARDYGVDASVENATETAGVLSTQLTIWGVPGDPSHNQARGWECVAGGHYEKQVGKPCPASPELPQAPFLISPTSCASDPARTPVIATVETDSWADPGTFLGTEYAWMNEEGQLLGFEGCEKLPFEPKLEVSPEEHTASTPTGLEVKVTVHQQNTLEAEKLAQADVRDTTVTLPAGVELSPSAANGLEGCSEEEIEGDVSSAEHEQFKRERATQMDEPGSSLASDPLVFPDVPPACPKASKVGTVKIKTPLLAHELEGAVYLASPAPNGEPGRNPFNSLVALYIVAEDPVSGVLVKLAGEANINEGSLQISTTFRNTPQVPFEELTLSLFGGPKASLSTPERCGSHATDGVFTPWSGTSPVSVSAEGFGVASGVGDSGCPAGALPFDPGFTAYSQNIQAGAFTPFTLELTRPDGDQALGSVSMHLPPGIAALLSSVELCSEAQADANACPAGSEVGRAIAFAGLGSEPYVQEGGKVFITGPYDGAPFGLDIVTPADAGPFDLGYISVRSKLYVNENDASVTVDSDPLPTEIRGIPLQLKRVIVEVDRSGFEFNPTGCEAKTISATIAGSEGTSANVSSPFKAENCGALPFSPQLSAGAVGHGSKAQGTTFKVTVTSGGVNSGGVAQAGIAKVNLQLPKQLSSRLPTLQKACTEGVFNSNPAACDEGSVIGYATIHTPVLRSPLSGPAYLVSHGNAAFPDVEFVLQGEGIKLVLDGKTQIKNEITYSKFESTPDAPFTTFETVLPAGPHGVLVPNVSESKHFDLCGETIEMPTTIVGQNGVRIEHNTKIAIEGCSAVKSVHVKKLTRVQLLSKALQACRKRYKHNKHARQRCEKQARKKYAAKKARHGKAANRAKHAVPKKKKG